MIEIVFTVGMTYKDGTERSYDVCKNPYEPGFYIKVWNKPAKAKEGREEFIFNSNSNHFKNFYYQAEAVHYLNKIVNYDLKDLKEIIFY